MREIKDLINAEFNYYLSKFVLEYLVHENIVSQEEAVSICDILKENTIFLVLCWTTCRDGSFDVKGEP